MTLGMNYDVRRHNMADDPIEKIGAELEIYGILQADGAPPMTDTYLHVRRRQDGAAERAVMGLPAYQGETGPPGPAGTVHQGERTTDELDALATVLDKTNTGYSYRNTDTQDQYVWSGETWVIYHEVYATPGPVGPAPTMTPGTLTVDGETQSGEFGVRVSGADGTYSVGLDLPKPPPGAKGDQGPAGPIFTSVDVDQSSTKTNGAALVYNQAKNKLEFKPTVFGTEEYVVGPPDFAEDFNIPGSTSRKDLFSVTIPAKTYPYRFDFSGGVSVNVPFGYHVDVEIRRDNASTGPLVGVARDDQHQGWHHMNFYPFSDASLAPDSPTGVIPAGTEVKLFAAAVRKQGSLLTWGVKRDMAQLRIKLQRVP